MHMPPISMSNARAVWSGTPIGFGLLQYILVHRHQHAQPLSHSQLDSTAETFQDIDGQDTQGTQFVIIEANSKLLCAGTHCIA